MKISPTLDAIITSGLDPLSLVKASIDPDGKEPRLVTPRDIAEARMDEAYLEGYIKRAFLLCDTASFFQETKFQTALAVLGDPKGSGQIKVVRFNDPAVQAVIRSLEHDTPIEFHGWSISDFNYYSASPDNSFIFSPEQVKMLDDDHYADPALRKRFWRFALGAKHIGPYMETVNREGQADIDYIMGLSFPPELQGMTLFTMGPTGRSDSYSWGSGHYKSLVQHVYFVGIASDFGSGYYSDMVGFQGGPKHYTRKNHGPDATGRRTKTLRSPPRYCEVDGLAA